MNTPAYADATLSNLAGVKNEPEAEAEAAAATRPDALFLVNNLGIGGSERKIVRLANRLNWWSPRWLRQWHLRFGIWENEPIALLDREFETSLT